LATGSVDRRRRVPGYVVPVGPATSEPPRLLLFDGTCAVCDATVQWVLRRDRRGRFVFAPLAGPTAADARARHPEWPSDLDSLVVVHDDGGVERIAWWSDAVIAIGRGLGGPWGVAASVGRWVPKPLRDAGYRASAARRYRWFGKVEACTLPSDEHASRFLP
jgi:predicted DCC family thiol-disulfide oxidoreductase YuxK